MATDMFSRESLAGYDRDVLARAVAVLVGCGAAGNNVAQNLALAGVGEMRFIDPDTVEPSNLTRSPLFQKERMRGKRARWKAREIALGAQAASYAPDPIVRFATSRVEALGLGVLAGAGVVVSAVDSFAVRAYLADATRLLGIPLVEIGFSAPRGQVSAFSNSAPDEPCWRCLHPYVEHGGVSCALYAAQVVAEGRVPATQTVAATFSAMAAEAAIQALHGRFPLGGKLLQMDVREGRSRLVELTTDPACPGVHRKFGTITTLDVKADDPLARIFDAIRADANSAIELPAPFLVEAPCARCGTMVHVGRPAWAITAPPSCRTCPTVPQIGGGGAVVATTVAPRDRLAERSCRTLGLPPAAIFEITDTSAATTRAFQLAGSVDDLFVTKRHDACNGNVGPRMIQTVAAMDAAKEE